MGSLLEAALCTSFSIFESTIKRSTREVYNYLYVVCCWKGECRIAES